MVKTAIMRTLKALVNKDNLKNAKSFKDAISMYDSDLKEIEEYLSIPEHITKNISFEYFVRQPASSSRMCYRINVKVYGDKAVVTDKKEKVKDELAECTKKLTELLIRKGLLAKTDKFTSKLKIFNTNNSEQYATELPNESCKDFINSIDSVFEKIIKDIKIIASDLKQKAVLLHSVDYDIYFSKMNGIEKVSHIVTSLNIK